MAFEQSGRSFKIRKTSKIVKQQELDERDEVLNLKDLRLSEAEGPEDSHHRNKKIPSIVLAYFILDKTEPSIEAKEY